MPTYHYCYQIMSKQIEDCHGFEYHKGDLINQVQLNNLMKVYTMIQVRVLLIPNE